MLMNAKIIFFALCCVFSFSLSAQKVILFGGENLKQWYAFEPQSGKHDHAEELFHVENRLIRFYGNKPGYLMSRQSFSEFRLTAEFRWNIDSTYVKASKNKNSGLMYLVPDTARDMLWCTGIQYQIKPQYTGDFIFLGGVTAEINGQKTQPGKSVSYPKILEAEKSPGQWNKIEIIYHDGSILQKLNGKVVNKAAHPSVTHGRILLQYEGYPIDFRKIVITEL